MEIGLLEMYILSCHERLITNSKSYNRLSIEPGFEPSAPDQIQYLIHYTSLDLIIMDYNG